MGPRLLPGATAALALLLLCGCGTGAEEASGDAAITDGGATPADTAFVEQQVVFSSGEIRLSGALTLPRSPGPSPAVVIVSGSGPQDRDGSTTGFVPGYRPSRALAHHLASRGVASLRYDERGVGESTGIHASASGADLADDAEAGFRYLRGRGEVDPDQVGLIGQSEGANIVAMIAARNPDVAFVVSLAGPGVRGYELVIAQSEHGLRASGLEGEELDAAMARVRAEYTMVLNGEWTELESMMRDMLPAQLDAMPEEERAELGTPDDIIAEELRRMQNWTQFFLRHDPTTDWARVQAPVLALFGGLDVQVPVEQNRPPFEDALRRSPGDVWTIRVLPRANHLFQRAETGQISEYFELSSEIDTEVLETISSWIRARRSR